MTLSITAKTKKLSCLRFWKIWIRVSIWNGLPSNFLMATLKCQDIPFLPNQSVWLSWYFLGMNFMAQSKVTIMAVLSKLLTISTWASSWLMDCNKCYFHALMLFFDCSTINFSSSFSCFGSSTFSITAFFSCNTAGKSLHLSHTRSCVWSQVLKYICHWHHLRHRASNGLVLLSSMIHEPII